MCMTTGGIASAAMVPSPTAPSLTTSDSASLLGDPPADIIKLVEDTATAVVDKVSETAGLKKTPSSAPARKPAVKAPALPSSRTAHPARTTAMPAASSWALRADSRFAELLPAMPLSLADAAARNPVVAKPASPATSVQNAASSAVIAERGNSVMRGVLIALAAASAATLAMAHFTALRGSSR